MKGHEITYELKEHGFTVSKIAKNLNVSQPTVSQVIYGKRSMSRIRETISQVIGKPVAEIWPDESAK
jgi:predicted transcriptional regulator